MCNITTPFAIEFRTVAIEKRCGRETQPMEMQVYANGNTNTPCLGWLLKKPTSTKCYLHRKPECNTLMHWICAFHECLAMEWLVRLHTN